MLKVLDFGIVRMQEPTKDMAKTRQGLVQGTPATMSPEQATGDRLIDARSDIYSLAAVLYEMLTGEPPHTGSTVQAIIARVLTDRVRPVRASRDTVPENVDAALQRALAKLPADRFATRLVFWIRRFLSRRDRSALNRSRPCSDFCLKNF